MALETSPGLQVKDALKKGLDEVEKRGIGLRKINYRLRDAIFGRQRYWGEPIPVYYKHGTAYTVSVNKLPLVLPEVDKYLPTESGEPPLARAKNWNYAPVGDNNVYPLETTTMPGWAGSSWYFLRYMDAKNDEQFVSKEKADYWKNVDLYMGGAEHATAHLLYVRFWTKFLNDRGYIAFGEPAKKLINQGMIQGTSALVYRVNGTNKQEEFAFHWIAEKPGKPLMPDFRLRCPYHLLNKSANIYSVVIPMVSSGPPIWVRPGILFIPVLITRLCQR